MWGDLPIEPAEEGNARPPRRDTGLAPDVDNLANWMSKITQREVSNTMTPSFHLRYVTASKGRNAFATANP